MKRLKTFNAEHLNLIVWIVRLLVGGTFIFSGFVKTVDPWGFFYKISDYLGVWHIQWVSREFILFLAVSISMFEFIIGIILATGSLRRMAAIAANAMMCVMLPLTAYILIANPVDDCGCFGDALVISNSATFIKNIFLSGGAIYLLRYNKNVNGLISPMLQWLEIMACVLFCLIVSLTGLSVQPILDFRPYPVGTPLISDSGEAENLVMIYEKDGLRKEFNISELPDSTWTFVERVDNGTDSNAAFAIFDGDEDVTEDVVSREGAQLILFVSEPSFHQRARASMANNLNDYISARGGSMISVVALPPDSLDRWIALTKPEYEVYTSDDTSIKEIVRGSAALVYTENGIIKWKRSIYSLPGDFPDSDTSENALDNVYVIDSGSLAVYLCVALGAVILLLILFSLPVRIRQMKSTTPDRARDKSAIE